MASPKNDNRYIYFIMKYYLTVKISLKFVKNASLNFAKFSLSRLGIGYYCDRITRDYSSLYVEQKIVKLCIIIGYIPLDVFLPFCLLILFRLLSISISII
jgi:hypothetical protein